MHIYSQIYGNFKYLIINISKKKKIILDNKKMDVQFLTAVPALYREAVKNCTSTIAPSVAYGDYFTTKELVVTPSAVARRAT